jgi:hypothetical protein
MLWVDREAGNEENHGLARECDRNQHSLARLATCSSFGFVGSRPRPCHKCSSHGGGSTASSSDAHCKTGEAFRASRHGTCELTGRDSFTSFFVCVNINKSPVDDF